MIHWPSLSRTFCDAFLCSASGQGLRQWSTFFTLGVISDFVFQLNESSEESEMEKAQREWSLGNLDKGETRVPQALSYCSQNLWPFTGAGQGGKGQVKPMKQNMSFPVGRSHSHRPATEPVLGQLFFTASKMGQWKIIPRWKHSLQLQMSLGTSLRERALKPHTWVPMLQLYLPPDFVTSGWVLNCSVPQ